MKYKSEGAGQLRVPKESVKIRLPRWRGYVGDWYSEARESPSPGSY